MKKQEYFLVIAVASIFLVIALAWMLLLAPMNA